MTSPSLPGERAGYLAAAVAVAAFAALPALAGAGTQAVVLVLLLHAALAQAWNLVGGYAGQMSLGHAAFVGTGAYMTGVATLHTGLPLPVALVLSGLAAAGLALVSCVALLRLRGVYFSIATLAVALAAQAWMVSWEPAGGSRGLHLPIAELPAPTVLYALALGLVVATSLTAWWLERSAFGLRVMAVRDDEDAARALGVNGTRVKATVFALSGFYAGAIGGVVALNQISLMPDNLFGMSWTVGMVVMAIVGGLGTVPGPLIGAVVMYYLIERKLESNPDVAALLAGIVVIAVIRFAPEGLWGLARRALQRVRLRFGQARGAV